MITTATSFAADFLLPNGKCYTVTTDLRRIIFDFAHIQTPAQALDAVVIHCASDSAWFHFVLDSYAHLQLGTVAEQKQRARERARASCMCRIRLASKYVWRCAKCSKYIVKLGSSTKSDIHTLMLLNRRIPNLLSAIAATTRINWGVDKVLDHIMHSQRNKGDSVAFYALMRRMCAETPPAELDDVCKRETGMEWVDILARVASCDGVAQLLSMREYSLRERAEAIETHLERRVGRERIVGIAQLSKFAACYADLYDDWDVPTASDLIEWRLLLQLALRCERTTGDVSIMDLNRLFRSIHAENTSRAYIMCGLLRKLLPHHVANVICTKRRRAPATQYRPANAVAEPFDRYQRPYRSNNSRPPWESW